MTEDNETRLERLEEENEQLKQRIEQLEQQAGGRPEWINRREMMGALAAAISVPAFVGSASASDTEPSNFDCVWTGDQNAANYDLWNLAGLDVNKLLSSLDVSGHDIEDSGSTVYDQSAGEVPNSIVAALSNFGVNDAFAAYPISLGNDTDADLDGTDLSDGNETVYDSTANELTSDVNSQSVNTDDIVDGGGVSHSGRLADLGEMYLSTYDTTIGGGSITDNSGVVEVREPGNASVESQSRLYSQIIEFDPSQTRRVRMNIQNVTIDNNLRARIIISLSDSPDSGRQGGSDWLFGEVRGDGTVEASVSDDGSTNFSTDSSQDNSFASALNYVELSFDGSDLTTEASDGSTTITQTNSGAAEYPSGETLHLKISAADTDGSNARNVDFDIDDVVVAD